MEKKKVLLSILPNIAFIFIIIFVKSLLPNINTIYGYILYMFSAINIYYIVINKPPTIKSSINTLLYISVFIVLFKYFSLWFGFIGVLFLLIIMSLKRIYNNKSLYFDGVRDIETRIFGKPLDKELWENDKNEEKR